MSDCHAGLASPVKGSIKGVVSVVVQPEPVAATTSVLVALVPWLPAKSLTRTRNPTVPTDNAEKTSNTATPLLTSPW